MSCARTESLRPRGGLDGFLEATPARVAVGTATDAASFSRLHQGWDDLVRAMPRPSPYLLHGWLSEWWRHYGAGRSLCVHVAFRDGKLVAALPLCVHERFGVRVLEFMGGGESVLADLLLADGEDSSLAVMLAQRAATSGQDFADLFGLSRESRLVAALGDRAFRLVPRIEAPVLDLKGSWEDAYQQMPSRRRREHRRRRRRLDALGRLELTIARTEVELQDALEKAFALYALRWHGRPDNSDFVRARGKAFERAAVSALAQNGVPRIVLLELDGRPVAFSYYFALEGRMYSHKLAFDPAFAAYSPGTLTLLDTLAAASEEGLTRVEFLGGAEPYKTEFADHFEPLYEVVGLVGGPVGAVALAARLGSIRLRLRLKRSRAAAWFYYRGLGAPRRLFARAQRRAADHD